MAQRIRNLRLSELSLVDRGANQGARVSIFKRDETNIEKGTDMDPELQKKIDEAIAKAIAPLNAQIETLTKANIDLTKANGTLTAELDVAKKAVDVVKGDEVLKVGDKEIRKSEVGGPMFEFAKAQQADIEKARDETLTVQFEKRAGAEFGNLPGTDIVKGRVLKAVSKMPKDEADEMEKMLKAGNAALGDLMKATGKDGDVILLKGDDKLEQLAKAYSEANKCDMIKARDEVMKSPEGKKAYAESEAERTKRAA